MPTIKLATVNTEGLQEIRAALAEHHKLGGEHFTPAMLAAWASEAEQSFSAGNGCGFEIRSFETNTGRPVEILLSPRAYDVTEVADE